jgi:hypothetical protein
MIYPVRVINNKIKFNIHPSPDIVLGEFNLPKKDNAKLHRFIALILLAVLACAVAVSAVLLIAVPFVDIVQKEKAAAEEIEDMNSDTPDVTLTRLLEENDIEITHRAGIGDTQAVITIAGDTELSLLLHITSQVSGVFGIQYSQDGFQIFIAGGSI